MDVVYNKGEIMTVQELINKLNKIEDKNLDVMIELDVFYEKPLMDVEIKEKSIILSRYVDGEGIYDSPTIDR